MKTSHSPNFLSSFAAQNLKSLLSLHVSTFTHCIIERKLGVHCIFDRKLGVHCIFERKLGVHCIFERKRISSFFYKFVFYTFVFYTFIFYNFIFYTFIFYTLFFYTFIFYTVHFLYGSFFIIQNLWLQPSIKKIIFYTNMAYYLTHAVFSKSSL